MTSILCRERDRERVWKRKRIGQNVYVFGSPISQKLNRRPSLSLYEISSPDLRLFSVLRASNARAWLLSLSISLSLSHTPSPVSYPFWVPSLSFFLIFSVSLSYFALFFKHLNLYFSLSLPLYLIILCIFLYINFCVSLFQSPTLLNLSLSFSIYLLFLNISFSRSFCLTQSSSLYVCLSVSLSHFVCFCLKSLLCQSNTCLPRYVINVPRYSACSTSVYIPSHPSTIA